MTWGSKRVKEKTQDDSNVNPPLPQQLHSRGYCEKAVNSRHMIKLTFVKQKHTKKDKAYSSPSLTDATFQHKTSYEANKMA